MKKTKKSTLQMSDSFSCLTENKCFDNPNHQDARFWQVEQSKLQVSLTVSGTCGTHFV